LAEPGRRPLELVNGLEPCGNQIHAEQRRAQVRERHCRIVRLIRFRACQLLQNLDRLRVAVDRAGTGARSPRTAGWRADDALAIPKQIEV